MSLPLFSRPALYDALPRVQDSIDRETALGAPELAVTPIHELQRLKKRVQGLPLEIEDKPCHGVVPLGLVAYPHSIACRFSAFYLFPTCFVIFSSSSC